jgi:hypothetical protein
MAIRVAAINTYRMYIEPGSTPGERRQSDGERRKAGSDRRRRDENAAERVTAELRKSFLFEHLPPEENNADEIPGISGEAFDARL